MTRLFAALGRGAYRCYLAVIIGGVAITALLALWPPATTAVHTAAFATQVLPSPVRIQSGLAPPPARLTTTYAAPDGNPVAADIYVIPDGRQRAGVVVFLGANAAGADDPDVVNLGQALARAGFAVLYHWSAALGTHGNIDPAEIDGLVAAYRHLQQQDFVAAERVGLAGFSVGASLALVAAADARIAHQVAFVNAFGGYNDAGDLLVQIAAGRTLDGAPWTVDALTRRVFENEVAESGTDVDAILRGAVGLDAAQRWYAATPPAFREQVRAVSPAAHLVGLHPQTAILLMHDRGDRLIPVGESRRLNAGLRQLADGPAVKYTETDIFRHVRPDSDTELRPLLKGAAQLFGHTYGIIARAR